MTIQKILYFKHFSLGRQSRADREKERHRALIGSTSGHHSPSPRDQFVHDQQQFLNAATSSGVSKTAVRPRSPSGNFVLDTILLLKLKTITIIINDNVYYITIYFIIYFR